MTKVKLAPNWGKEVKDKSDKRAEARKTFYERAAKVNVGSDIQKILDNPNDNGYKSLKELREADTFDREINPEGKAFKGGQGWSLSECLTSYFMENVGIEEKGQAWKEVALSLHYLSQNSINVDDLAPGSTVKIEKGLLFITGKDGKAILNGAPLRPDNEAAVAPEKDPATADDSYGYIPPNDDEIIIEDAVPAVAEDDDDEEEPVGSDFDYNEDNEANGEGDVETSIQDTEFTFERSEYDPTGEAKVDEAVNLILTALEGADENGVKINLRDTADKTLFKLNAKGDVNVAFGKDSQENYVRAMKALQDIETIDKTLDFETNGLEAIHALLPVKEQQKAMNNALAYLRAEKLQTALEGKLVGKKVNFEIATEWTDDPEQRISTIMGLEFAPKKPEIDEIIGLFSGHDEVMSKATVKSGLLAKKLVAHTEIIDGENFYVLYASKDKNPMNPPKFIAISESDPRDVAIGHMKYTSSFGGLTVDASCGAVQGEKFKDKLTPGDAGDYSESVAAFLEKLDA